MLRFIDQKSEPAERCVPIIEKLLVITSQSDDMRKIIQSKFVRKIIETITSAPQTKKSLECLATLMKEYSGTSGVFKNQIYDYCISGIDKCDFELITRAASCLNQLQQTRGGEVGGTAHQKNWAEFHGRLLNTLDELFVTLLATGEDINIGKSEKLKLPSELKSSSDIIGPLVYTQHAGFIRFKNVCIILEAALSRAFLSPKTVQLNRIISFVDKRATYCQAQVNKKEGESHVPYVLHIEIQKSLLNLLKAVVSAANFDISLHSKDTCDILWKLLKSTNTPFNETTISDTL
jgi:hypothetical protein